MSIPVFNLDGESVTRINTPFFFKVKPREDLVRRAFTHIYSHVFQPKGRMPDAGRKPGAEYFGTGLGLARVPRIKHPPLRGRAANVAMARGGRRPHVTPVEKKISKKINRKERLLALVHAAAATANRELILARGHRISKVPHIPLIVSSEIEEVSKTRDLVRVLENLGLREELERVKNNVKIVGGKASWRGRRKKIRKGPLIVYGLNRNIVLSARNVMGVDVINARNLTVTHLAPGGVIGRLTIWTLPAISVLEKRLINRVKVIEYV